MKSELGIGGLTLMYVGNLQPYQGIDLLLESFALVLKQTEKADLVIIGGQTSDIRRYHKKAYHLGIGSKVHFCGPRPLERLGEYLCQADILVSPRITGNNTPMKLYSYLHSGIAIVATDLPMHTQVLDSRVAMLAAPSPQLFSEAILRLIQDANLRWHLGQAGKKMVEEQYSYAAFLEKLTDLFDWLDLQMGPPYSGELSKSKPLLKEL